MAESSESPITTTLHDYVTEAAAAGFSGSIFVSRKDEVLLAAGFGLANEAADTPRLNMDSKDLLEIKR